MLQNRNEHFVRFFHQNGSNVISGEGWYTGRIYYDPHGNEYCEIQYEVPGMAEPPYDEDTQDEHIHVWVPVFNVTEVTDAVNEEPLNLYLGNNSSFKYSTNDWMYSIATALSSALGREHFRRCRINIQFRTTSDRAFQNSLDTIKKVFQLVFGDKWVNVNTTSLWPYGYINMTRSDCEMFINNPLVSQVVRQMSGGYL